VWMWCFLGLYSWVSFIVLKHSTETQLVIVITAMVFILALPLNFCRVKFVGLFVVALIGLSVIGDLWKIVGNKSIPLVRNF